MALLAILSEIRWIKAFRGLDDLATGYMAYPDVDILEVVFDQGTDVMLVETF